MHMATRRAGRATGTGQKRAAEDQSRATKPPKAHKKGAAKTPDAAEPVALTDPKKKEKQRPAVQTEPRKRRNFAPAETTLQPMGKTRSLTNQLKVLNTEATPQVE